jgi:large subunit ribosomal protein L13
MKTFNQKPDEVQRSWHLIDANDVVLGKLAVSTANLLRGKTKPTYSPNVDCGDFVVIVNAEKISLSGNKIEGKNLYHHSGFMGGMKTLPYQRLLRENPTKIVEHAIRGMIPSNKLRKGQLNRLKIYVGSEHKHQAQNPKTYSLNNK